MRRSLLPLALASLIALAVGGCARSGGVDATGDGRPDLRVRWGESTYTAGPGGAGVLTIPLEVTNLVEGQPIRVDAWDVGLRGPRGRTCVARSTQPIRVRGGRTATLTLRAQCPVADLPARQDAALRGTVHYAVGGRPLVLQVDEPVRLRI